MSNMLWAVASIEWKMINTTTVDTDWGMGEIIVLPLMAPKAMLRMFRDGTREHWADPPSGTWPPRGPRK